MVIYTKVENGKCLLEFQFFYEEERPKQPISLGDDELVTTRGDKSVVVTEIVHACREYFVEIGVMDRCGEAVFRCNYPVKEEELAKGLLFHPHFWNGPEDPYLYKVSARLMCKEDNGATFSVDERKQLLPIRSFCQMERKGWYLNDKPFEIRGVLYSIPLKKAEGGSVLEQIKTDMELLRQMGANTICLEGRELDEEVVALCEEMGFVIWCGVWSGMLANGCGIPCFYEDARYKINALSEGEQHNPTDLYFYCKACWSRELFVHIVASSMKRQDNGNYSLTVYSNHKRVALYVDGVLFEFRVGAPKYVFEEIPGKKMPLLITVEAGECRKSMTFY